jgi:peptidyl-prolyl cis-trans isomerase A (cyclophilin A)
MSSRFPKRLSAAMLASSLSIASLFTFSAFATTVTVETSHGNFIINLHDETTPITVENFLNYVSDGDYDDTIVHRTVNDFVIQAGGAKFEGTLPPTWIDTDGTILNEPLYSNVRGTIAMAKGSNVNSASSQWFINLKNNDFLDSTSNNAFTVFGEVTEGMDVVELISNESRCNTNYSGFTEVPMPNFTCTGDNVPGADNFVNIISVTITDSSTTTASSLSPVMNTSLDSSDSSGGSSGGTLGFGLLALVSLWIRKKIK